MDDTVTVPKKELACPRIVIQVVGGPDVGKTFELDALPIHIGRHEDNDITLRDAQVSSKHLMIVADPNGYRLRDLGSRNGTYIDGFVVTEAILCGRARLRIGATVLSVQFTDVDDSLVEQGKLIGRSPPMIELRAQVERLAASDATVLVTGETGTGKEVIAESIHGASARCERPFVVVDCGAIPGELFEAELFGHERGAFTGAVTSSPGLFERADGGTIFLDEIGELPMALQPKLLRAVQTRTIRRVGGTRMIPCDVRLIAATHRDLRKQVAAGKFRADLYYRLAVACVSAPALRERGDDVALLARHFARDAAGNGALMSALDAALSSLRDHAWPGNVRELRNVVERALCGCGAPEAVTGERSGFTVEVRFDIPFKDAKQAVMDEFDRRFITRLLEETGGNIAEAARAAGLDRVSIYKIMARLGMARRGSAA